uniref:Anoctamin n=1 Tax=Oryzias latipes TaxID=8090 RepID=A0A3P9MDF8_ORYLA
MWTNVGAGLHQGLLTEYYYILVGKKEKKDKQKAFIEELGRKNIEVKDITREKQIFYGLRAEETVLKKYQDLLKVSDTCHSEDMNMTSSHNDMLLFLTEGLEDLMKKGVFETFYCLHDRVMVENFLFLYRKHFGEKVALFYLWLGWYTTFLIPAAVVGLLVFLCGMAFFDNNPLIEEVCDSNITLCPRCDKNCKPQNMNDNCFYAKSPSETCLWSYSDCVFMVLSFGILATTLLELWKRYRAKQVSKWEVYDWDEEEELILELVNDPGYKPKKRHHSYGWNMVLLAGGTLMILLIIGIAPALVVFRVTVRPLLLKSSWQFIEKNANTLVSILGAVLHYITIQIMNRIIRLFLNFFLYFPDKSKSRSDREKTFTIMMFTFQFFTLFSSLFYVAFFLGRINGYPGNYSHIAGQRLEECHPSGCLTNLFIQMIVIMTLSQFFSNIAELTKPWPKNCCGKGKPPSTDDKHQYCWKERCDDCLGEYWEKNYELTDTNDYNLFCEILKMVIQFSFTTLFVAAFPLAPLMALINNIGAIRLAAIRMVRLQRLLVPKKTNSIGVWTNVLEAIGVLAVITNGLVIGVTSEFIPRLVYRYGYGPCAMGVTNTHCMSGYINSTLTTAYMLHNKTDEFVSPKQRHFSIVTECSFRGFRDPDDHSVTSQFWWVLAARFTFIIAFEHLLLMFKAVTAWFVPSESHSVKNDRLKNKLERLKQA